MSGAPIAPGAHLRIIDVGGAFAVSGTFDGLPEGASVAVNNGVRFRITYDGGTGNDVELVTEAGPPTFTWDGGSTTTNLWSDAANWVGDVAPTAGAALVFPAGAAQLTNSNDLTAGTALESMVVGSGYVLNGNGVTLANGLNPETLSGSATVNLGVTLAAAQFFTTADTFSLTLGGPVNLNGFGLTVNGTGTLALTGAISGAGGIVKIENGILALYGDNTYSGVTDIRSGSLEVYSNNGAGATGTGNETQLGNGTTMGLQGGSLNVPEPFRLGQSSSGQVVNIVMVTGDPGISTLSGPLNVIGETNIAGIATTALITGTLTGSGPLGLTHITFAASSVSPAYAGELSGNFEFDGQAPSASSEASNLSGTGTLGFVDASGSGVVRPGINGIGTLHAHGFEVFQGGGTIIPVQPGILGITVSAAGAGQVAVIGTVTLGGRLDVTFAARLCAGGRHGLPDHRQRRDGPCRDAEFLWRLHRRVRRRDGRRRRAPRHLPRRRRQRRGTCRRGPRPGPSELADRGRRRRIPRRQYLRRQHVRPQLFCVRAIVPRRRERRHGRRDQRRCSGHDHRARFRRRTRDSHLGRQDRRDARNSMPMIQRFAAA